MTQIPQQFTERKGPATSLRLPVRCEFKQSSDAKNGVPVELLARSNEPVSNWYWGDIYHDFSGMQVKGDSIPIDYCHDDDEIMGASTKHSVQGDGLHVFANLYSLAAGDCVDRVTQLAAKGVPYEASIDFRGSNILAEEVGSNMVASVNGKQITGPALIFRQWPLRRVAICPSGMDQNTSAQFSQDEDDQVCVRIFKADSMTMPAKSGEQSPPQQQSADKPAEGKEVPQQQQEAPAAPQQQSEAKPAGDAGSGGGDPKAQWTAELKKYTDKFGAANGTQWFTEGKTWAQACELHADLASKQLAAKEEENKQLSEKLKSLHTGEETPAALSEDGSQPTPDGSGGMDGRFAHMGKVGSFASTIKLPGGK